MIGVSQAQTIQYIGAPTTTVISRGNFRTDSIFYLPKRSKAPTDTAAFRYQISDSSLYVWTGSQWVKAGGSGTISGSGITGYVPQFSASTTLDTSALFTLGSRLGIGTTSFAYNSTNTANMELNGTAGGILGFKRNDSARGYLWHTGDNMELANTVAGSISFNTNSATRGSISSAGVWRLHNLAGTGDRVVVASSNGTLSASTSVTGLVDTTTISTRAWRQKAVDSLQANINAKGSGTVTSVATGYGLSGGTITTTGTFLVDTLNIATRAWRQKGIDSVVSIIPAAGVGGSGTTNYVAKFTASSTIGDSQIFDNGTSVGIGTASPIGGILDVATSATAVTRIRSTNASNGAYLLFQNGTTGTGGSNGYLIGTDNSLSYVWNYESKPISFATNATERLRITSGGDVAIGTTTPGYSQTNRGNLTINGSDAILVFKASNVNAGYLYHNATSLLLNNALNGPLLLYSNDTERLRIFANGRVGINTTTDAGYQLDINGTLRSVNGANFATTSGNVGIGGVATYGKFQIYSGTATQVGLSLFTALESAERTTYVANEGLQLSSYQSIATSPFTKVSDIVANGDGTSAALMRFWTKVSGSSSPVEAMRINSTQELLINTTSDAGDYKLQVSGNIYNTGSAVLAATSGNVGIGTTSPDINSTGNKVLTISGGFTRGRLQLQNTDNISTGVIGGSVEFLNGTNTIGLVTGQLETGSTTAGFLRFDAGGNTERMRISSTGEVLIATTTDAGDYKLQVVGNARVGTGKLDIASNTTFGLGVARSGTSEVAGQIYNSNGILYLGAESSAGGQIFTGSSAYAAVIGSGAAYPLQFATDNVTRATINTNGELLINTTTDNGDFKLQVNGNALVSGSIKTANGGSSTAVPWHLGSVVATNVQLDTANYVEVEINGVFYRLAIVTPL